MMASGGLILPLAVMRTSWNEPVSRVVAPVDSVIRGSGELSSGESKLTSGSGVATAAFAGMPQARQPPTVALWSSGLA
jgi:hypothetical protein